MSPPEVTDRGLVHEEGRLSVLALGACLAVIGLWGCGGEEDQIRPSEPPGTARQVATQWVDARNSREYETLCDLYTQEIQAELQRGYGSCEEFYAEAIKPPPQQLYLAKLSVRGDEADATLGSGNTLYAFGLTRSGEGWVVSVLGP